VISPVSSLVQVSGREYTVEPLDHLEPLKGGCEVGIAGIALGERQCQLMSLVVCLLEPRGILVEG
jgi:hypothetical protein